MVVVKVEELKLKEEELKLKEEQLTLEEEPMEPNEHLEKYSEEVPITPQENPSRRSSVFGSLMTSCRRPSVPFSQVLLKCRPPFGSLGRSFSWFNGWSLPSLRCSSLSGIFSRSIFSCFQSLLNKIGKIVIIVCGISCASLVVFSWPAFKIYIRAHFCSLRS